MMMVYLPSLFLIISAQDTVLSDSRLHDRVGRLGGVCGEWSGLVGGEEAFMSLDMEDSSSAVGELELSGMIYFMHCFAEDMVTDDNVTAGFDADYQYCFLQQSGGETVGVFYMSEMSGELKGICIRNGNIYPSAFKMTQSHRSTDFSKTDQASLEEDKWNVATYMATREAYESYLSEFPAGRYVNEARGRLRILEAFEAEVEGDHFAALSALRKAENHIPLTYEALSLKEKAEEGVAYDRFALAETPEESILYGMDFVNEFMNSDRRAKVSDKVARLMASSPMYLAGTPADVMLTYAVTDETREYVLSQTRQVAKERYRKSSKSGLGFNGGIGGSLETPSGAFEPVYGGHIFFSIGDYRNFLNFEMGLRYRYWAFTDTSDASEFDFHQVRLFMAPKFNIIRQKRSAFYLYVAPEASYGYPVDMHGTGFYEANTLSVGGRAGIGVGRIELSASYTYDYWPMVNADFTGSYSHTMAGVALTFCFSGSGRK